MANTVLCWVLHSFNWKMYFYLLRWSWKTECFMCLSVLLPGVTRKPSCVCVCEWPWQWDSYSLRLPPGQGSFCILHERAPWPESELWNTPCPAQVHTDIITPWSGSVLYIWHIWSDPGKVSEDIQMLAEGVPCLIHDHKHSRSKEWTFRRLKTYYK